MAEAKARQDEKEMHDAGLPSLTFRNYAAQNLTVLI